MKTHELVRFLATGVEPVPSHPLARRYVLALGLGLAGASALMLGLLGVRPDLDLAVRQPLFWLKLAFVALVAWASLLAVLRLARPGVRLRWVPVALLAPVLLLWSVAGAALAGAEPAVRPALLLGATWRSCPGLIALLSLPLVLTLFWAMRGLAPTRPLLAGAASGLLAGSAAALVYCLHCPEQSPPFVGTWYLLGMLLPALLGAPLGARLLRW